MKSKVRRSRRPRFVSLRRQLCSKKEMTTSCCPVEEGNVAERFFAGVEGCANTLTGLLEEEEESESVVAESPLSSVTAAYKEGRSLVRAAMRSHGEEDEEELRWVRMSEVQVSDEVSSSSSISTVPGWSGLALKLDYKEVEEAWGGSTPFFSSPHSSHHPQIVPDLTIPDDFFYHHHHHQLNAANGVLWGVPDNKSCIHHGMDENGDKSIEGWRLGQREASVLRYKEKRMNRLFSKRIRYQVRKLNAEKRPRVKGRFVKRN